VNPDDRVGRRLSPSSHAHTLKRHFAITRTGGKEGDNLSLGKKNDPVKRTWCARTPTGTRARVRRSGRRRGRRSMGRFPFLTDAKTYLSEVRHYYRPATLEEIDRKLRYLARIFGQLRREAVRAGDLTFSTNPHKMGEREIAAFLGWMKARNLDPATQHKYLGILQGLTDWAGNGVLRQMRARKRFRIIVPPKRLDALSGDDLERIRRGAEAIEGWRGDCAQFLVNVLPYCGLRPKEIRLARLVDVDTTRWHFAVAHPKGEQAWASVDVAPILPPGRQPMRDFLDARAAFLRAHGLDPAAVEALLPYASPKTGRVGYWDDSVMIRLKCEIERMAGVRFKIKDFRPTFAQLNKDRNVGIEAVSKMLRHRTTRTTELFYARIRDEKAFAEAERAWGVGISIPAD